MSTLVEQHIAGLELSTSLADTKAWFHRSGLDVVILVQDELLLGVLDPQFLFENTEHEEDSILLSDYILEFPEEVDRHSFVRVNDHLFSLAETFSHSLYKFLPLVDHQHKLIGVSSRKDTLEQLCSTLNMDISGTIVDVMLTESTNPISEIIRLIETEGAQVYTLSVQQYSSDEYHGKLSMKISSDAASNAIATLERFGYTVFIPHRDLQRDIDFHERANELIRLLDL
jgi:hypothetical protein